MSSVDGYPVKMLGKKEYANGQKVYELEDNILTYFYEDGTVKAKGLLLKIRWNRSGFFTVNQGSYGRSAILKQIRNTEDGSVTAEMEKWSMTNSLIMESS